MEINNQYGKELHFDNIHRFLTAIRKSDMEININVSDKGINYELSSKKPFNEDNWNKAIKRMIEEKEITKEEAKIFNKMIETLLHYA